LRGRSRLGAADLSHDPRGSALTYLDTSALIKRFVAERGSTSVTRLTRPDAPVGTATIAYAETYSGLTRRHRDGDLSAIDYANACEQFERDWTGYLRICLDDDVLGAARLVIRRHALRGFDGIHLASALTRQSRWDEPVVVVAADQRLLRAAAAAVPDQGSRTTTGEEDRSERAPQWAIAE
jgi:predicted nucleic acid-binding protein